MSERIGILGAGGWGTALAMLLSRNGHRIRLWEFNPEVVGKIQKTGENPDYLPGVRIPKEVRVSSKLEEVVPDEDLILIAIPSHLLRSVVEKSAPMLPDSSLVVSCSKGIENNTLMRMSEVLRDTIPGLGAERIVVLSGPSHAEEVARGIPTAITAASDNLAACKRIQETFMNPVFRIYASQDVTGVELGGALKNVIAVAAGISDGVGYGDNTKAALLTRGIVEITRLGSAMGANPMTFAGLSGIGDLIVTCTSRYSRNRYVGEQVGKGKSLDEVLSSMLMVAEGVRTTRSAVDLSARYGVEMPITKAVYEVLFERKNPVDAVRVLMTRNPKVEDWR